MINARAEQFVHEKEAAHLRRLAITQLCLWGWEPTVYRQHDILRLLQRTEQRAFAKAIVPPRNWEIISVDPAVMHVWESCEWARFTTWALRYAVQLIGAPWP